MRYLLYAYILLIPFLHALSPVPIQTLGFFLLVAASPFIVLTRGAEAGTFTRQDTWLVLALIWGFVAWWLYPVPIGDKRFQDGAQWVSTVVFSLLIVRKLIIISRVRMEDVGRAACVSIIILSVAVVADFYLANFRSMRLSDIIPYSVKQFPEAQVMGLWRPRGLTVEAGFNGVVYECLAPFSIYYLIKTRNILSVFSALSMIFGFVLISSLLTIISVFSAVSILFLVKKRSFISLILIGIFIPVFMYFTLSNQFMFNLFGYKVAEFLDAANYNVYGVGRQGSFFFGLELFSQNILGIGWGTVLQEANIPGTVIDYNLEGGGLISLWLELLVASGIFGFAFFAYVFGKNIKGLAAKGGRSSAFIFVSLTAVSLHHIFLSGIWFPMIWFSLAVAQVALSRQYGPYFLSSGSSRKI